MKRLTIVFWVLLSALTVPAKKADKLDWPGFLAQHDMIWKELPLQWNEGVFTGNGQVGMMVYATLMDNRIDFHLGRQDVTDHRKAPEAKTSMGVPGTSVMYDFPRLDIGRMALRPSGKILSGTFHMDLWNAEIRGKIITSLGEMGPQSEENCRCLRQPADPEYLRAAGIVTHGIARIQGIRYLSQYQLQPGFAALAAECADRNLP